MSIEVSAVSKSFNQFKALDNVSLKVGTGELVSLLGPSGCGKTTLLRVIAGMEATDPGSGPILFDGHDVSDQEVGKRRIGFVFQSYALFKHMSVFENIAFGLRAKPWRQRPREAEICAKVEELLQLVQLQNFANRYPSQLSGGQRQRVALARALAVEPNVLLLDEPFGALDATVRRELRRWLRKLHQRIHVTTILVTHDQAVNSSDANGVTFVRPHDIEIRRENPDGAGIAAKVSHIAFAGSLVNVELARVDDQAVVDAALSAHTYRNLGLKPEDKVFIRLHNTRSFAEGYSI
jgi:sulfate transport system ATP-binding protein